MQETTLILLLLLEVITSLDVTLFEDSKSPYTFCVLQLFDKITHVYLILPHIMVKLCQGLHDFKLCNNSKVQFISNQGGVLLSLMTRHSTGNTHLKLNHCIFFLIRACAKFACKFSNLVGVMRDVANGFLIYYIYFLLSTSEGHSQVFHQQKLECIQTRTSLATHTP